MALSREESLVLDALLEEIFEEPRPKPKAVVANGEVVREADVHVSSADPNATEEVSTVHVRRTRDDLKRQLRRQRQRAQVPAGAKLREDQVAIIDDSRLGVVDDGKDMVGHYSQNRDGSVTYTEVQRPIGGHIVSEYNPFKNFY